MNTTPGMNMWSMMNTTDSSSSNSIALAAIPGSTGEEVQQLSQPGSFNAPLLESYNEQIRPLLDAIDKLRHLNIAQEGIQLPTIVVVGDQSSGKSSVLESLARISLPRGQGICTRVPLIMRLQNHNNSEAQLHLEYSGKTVPTDEPHVAEAINAATDEIAGDGKGISNSPLTLVVQKQGVPDLTMVDLPGITRVPVHGQPQDIYDQISAMIMEYIKPEESIILNVLSATVDFPTCESIRMSQQVDKTGQRTLAVVTKSDKSPEGLLEKVTADDVNIGLGYVCVRNRIGDESYDDARVEECKLFGNHPLLSQIDKSMVSVPVLAQKLVQIQAAIISKCLPEIVQKIDEKLKANVSELNKIPRSLSSPAEAMATFMQIISLCKESLRKVLLRADFNEYPDEKSMHGTARLAEMLNWYYVELHKSAESNFTKNFLSNEMDVLREAMGIGLPNFLPHSAFMTILQRKVNGISEIPAKFVTEVWNYIETVVQTVVRHHSENYPQLQSPMNRAVGKIIGKMKERSLDRVMEYVEMEKVADYTCSPEYMSDWNMLMAELTTFQKAMVNFNYTTIDMKWLGYVEIGHLRSVSSDLREQAFDIKMRIAAYWKIVLKRFVDLMGLHVLYSVQNLVNRDLEMELVNVLVVPDGGVIQKMLEEPPSVAKKREKLNRSIKLLNDSKDVVAQIMGKINIYGGY